MKTPKTLIAPLSDDTEYLLSGVSQQLAHEMRNILGSICGFLTLLQRDCEIDPESARFLSKVKKGADRLEHLVEDLALLANDDPPHLVRVDVGEALQHAVACCLAAFQENEQRVDLELVEPLPAACIDLDVDLFARMVRLMVTLIYKNLLSQQTIFLTAHCTSNPERLHLIAQAENPSYHVVQELTAGGENRLENQRLFTQLLIGKILRLHGGDLGEGILAGKVLRMGVILPMGSPYMEGKA